MSTAAIDQIGIEAYDATAKSVYRKLLPLTGAGATPLPFAFELQAGADARITLHAYGLRGGQIRVMREAIVTLPQGHAKYFRVQLEWICSGLAGGTFTATETHYQNTCGDEKTCRTGACLPSAIDTERLPDTAPDNAACFDTGCFAESKMPMKVTPDANCTIPLPPGDGMVNVGMVTSGDGPCGSATCTVPLDHDKDNGWIESGATAQLPRGVCDALTALKISALVVARCPNQKTPTTPPCPPNADAGTPPPTSDAAPDSGQDG